MPIPLPILVLPPPPEPSSEAKKESSPEDGPSAARIEDNSLWQDFLRRYMLTAVCDHVCVRVHLLASIHDILAKLTPILP